MREEWREYMVKEEDVMVMIMMMMHRKSEHGEGKQEYGSRRNKI